MKIKRVNRYYCDHCGRGGCNAAHIRNHEPNCLKNPNRGCFLCKENDRDYPSLTKGFKDNDLHWLRNAVDGCPACMLAVILQTPLDAEEQNYCYQHFDYREEVSEYHRSMQELRGE